MMLGDDLGTPGPFDYDDNLGDPKRMSMVPCLIAQATQMPENSIKSKQGKILCMHTTTVTTR